MYFIEKTHVVLTGITFKELFKSDFSYVVPNDVPEVKQLPVD